MEIVVPEILPPTSEPLNLGENPERDPLFRTRDLTKVYSTGDVEVRALNGVDLDLFVGELVVLLGPSGSGNST